MIVERTPVTSLQTGNLLCVQGCNKIVKVAAVDHRVNVTLADGRVLNYLPTEYVGKVTAK